MVPVFWGMSGWNSAICMPCRPLGSAMKYLDKSLPRTEFVQGTLGSR
jgi:hypothetical protein